jgi:hypothetical protein
MKVMTIFSFLASQINQKKSIWQLCFLFLAFKHIMCVTLEVKVFQIVVTNILQTSNFCFNHERSKVFDGNTCTRPFLLNTSSCLVFWSLNLLFQIIHKTCKCTHMNTKDKLDVQ